MKKDITTHKDTDYNLKCCGNCIMMLVCGMSSPDEICVCWTFDNKSRKDRMSSKYEKGE